ncbi:MarR family winged helix-turn-helix transcriptional regulator [Dactylosporangium sp. CA-233914]|uniref:MarR family winged helix-turn-helix transcriptional regulator n=1 Tax=Dactylosporangium sp. CA-233914 TaxID=3239934 RepID=UPI003D8D2481
MESGGGQALFAFVRYWSRRWTGADPDRGRDVLALEAVRALSARLGAPPSVNDVAHELGLDQSGASRLLSRAERLGLLARRSARGVGAATTVTVTPPGEELLRQAHAWQDEVLAELTAGWPDEDVRTLVALMSRLIEGQSGYGRGWEPSADSARSSE